MKIDNNINKVVATNLEIKRIMSGGGVFCGKRFISGTSIK